MQNLFQEVGKEAMNVGYSAEEIDDANCITAAFVDETVGKLLARHQPWTPLFATMFSRTDAGEAVFQRLHSIQGRPASAHQRDLLEIYYLCFLLGYEGRFAGWQNEREDYKEQMRRQIDGLRPIDPRLSPLANLQGPPAAAGMPMAMAPVTPAPRQSSAWLAISAGCLAVAGVSWVAAKALLNSEWHGILNGMVRP
jgi:type IV/VI secretion system ImpK/VasF family protein